MHYESSREVTSQHVTNSDMEAAGVNLPVSYSVEKIIFLRHVKSRWKQFGHLFI